MNSLDSLSGFNRKPVDGVTAEDFVLMLNMGWSLQDIATQAGMPVKTLERIIVAEVTRERLAAKTSACG
jgi:hypothetical protein